MAARVDFETLLERKVHLFVQISARGWIEEAQDIPQSGLIIKMETHDFVKTEIYVKAYLKQLEIHGIPAYVSRHGDDDAGDLIVKICTLDGRASLFRREYNLGTGERHWTCVLSSSEAEVDRFIRNNVV